MKADEETHREAKDEETQRAVKQVVCTEVKEEFVQDNGSTQKRRSARSRAREKAWPASVRQRTPSL